MALFHSQTRRHMIKSVIKYCEKLERSSKNLRWFIKNSGEVLGKLKARDFNATSLSTYVFFSALYTTLLQNLIKYKLTDLIDKTFKREHSPYIACNDRNAFFTSEKPTHIMHGLVIMYVMCWPLCWTIFLYDLTLRCINRLYRCQWVLIVLPWLRIYSCFVMKETLRCLFLMLSRMILF